MFRYVIQSTRALRGGGAWWKCLVRGASRALAGSAPPGPLLTKILCAARRAPRKTSYGAESRALDDFHGLHAKDED